MFYAMYGVVQQCCLPEFEPLARDGLFFSIFPDAATAVRIARFARHCRRQFGFSGRPLATSRFHISLQDLGEYEGMPESVVAKASDAAAIVRAAPFAVMFDRVGSFSGRAGNRPLVLRGDDGVVGLTMLHQSLGSAMRTVGLKARLDFTPHVTLLYDDRRIDEQAIEPIIWTVHEFILVRSLIGRTKHIPLGRWQLHG
jgi:RNA 2',3'-cyclic 3'-phosphodiesterase